MGVDGLPVWGKYLTVMLPIWLPLLQGAGDLDKPFATGEDVSELEAMSAATIDRYLTPTRRSMQRRGIAATADGRRKRVYDTPANPVAARNRGRDPHPRAGRQRRHTR